MTDTTKFWKTKQLEEMTSDEWESLCDGCGRCCVFKVREEEGSKLHWTDVGCPLLDCESGRCTNYPNRLESVPDCFHMTPEIVRSTDVLPPSCGYRRAVEGRDLAWWHPLISGDPNTVHRAGISVRGRTIPPGQASDLVRHVVDWPDFPRADADDLSVRERALFAGANADMPTPFTDTLAIDLPRMARHCQWLLRNGCSGLVVFGDAGEGQSLGVSERLSALEGLIERGVPASKLLPATGTAAIRDTMLLTREAEAMGCRGVLLGPPFYYKSPHEAGIAAWFDAVVERSGGRIRLYMDHAERTSGVVVGLETTRALFARHAGRLAGIRISEMSRDAALALTTGFAADGIEVYAGSADLVGVVMDAGGAGCMTDLAAIAPGLANRICALGSAPGRASDHVGLQTLHEALAGASAPSRVKAILATASREEAWRRVRPPLEPQTVGWSEPRLKFLIQNDMSFLRLSGLPGGSEHDSKKIS